MRGFALFLLAVIVVALAMRVYPAFSVIYFIAAVYILVRLWARRALHRLEVERQFADHAFFGDQVRVDLALRNAKLLPVVWLALREQLPAQFFAGPLRYVTSLSGYERWRTSYVVDCQRRGYYPIGPLEIETGDLLGIQPPRKVRLAAHPLIVYPRMLTLQSLGLPSKSPLAALAAPDPLFEDPVRITGVRDYQRGDSPRRIHWTATASAGRLLVKQIQPTMARETLICLNLRASDYDERLPFRATEFAITVAASLAQHMISAEGLAVGLGTEGWDMVDSAWLRWTLPPHHEQGHLMALLEVLARVRISPRHELDPLAIEEQHFASLTFADQLRSQTLDLGWGSTVVVITGAETLDLLDALALLRRSGFAVVLMLVEPQRRGRQSGEQARMLNIPVHRLWEDPDLEAVR